MQSNSENIQTPAAATLNHLKTNLNDRRNAKWLSILQEYKSKIPKKELTHGHCKNDDREDIIITAVIHDLLLKEHDHSEKKVNKITRQALWGVEGIRLLSTEQQLIHEKSDIARGSLDAATLMRKKASSLPLNNKLEKHISFSLQEEFEELPPELFSGTDSPWPEIKDIMFLTTIVIDHEKVLEDLVPAIDSLISAKRFVETVPVWNELIERTSEVKGGWAQIARKCQAIYYENPENSAKKWLLETADYKDAFWSDVLSDFKAYKAQFIAIAAHDHSTVDGDPIVVLLWKEVDTAWAQAIETCQRGYELAPERFQDSWLMAIKNKFLFKDIAKLISSSDIKRKPKESEPPVTISSTSVRTYYSHAIMVSYQDKQHLEKKIGYSFRDQLLLTQALTHSSYPYSKANNQRLEFLGDSLINFIVTKKLYEDYPKLQEGKLTNFRTNLVKGSTLHDFAQRIELKEHILTASGEVEHVHEKSCSILGDAFEALAAAIYLDGGLEAAERFILKATEESFQQPDWDLEEANPKGRLQEIFQASGLGSPVYDVIEKTDQNGVKTFFSSIIFEGDTYGTGFGRNKKESEKAAALKALQYIKKLAAEK